MLHFQRFLPLSFWITVIIVLSSTQSWTQTYEIELTTGNWTSLTGSALAICPNKEYKIRINHTSSYKSYVSVGAGSMFTTIGTLGNPLGTAAICADHVNTTGTPPTTEIFAVKFAYSMTSQTIDITEADGMAACAAGVGAVTSFEFIIQNVAATMPSDMSICENSGDLTVTATAVSTEPHQWYKSNNSLDLTAGSVVGASFTPTIGSNSITILEADFPPAGQTMYVALVTTFSSGLACVDIDSTIYTIEQKPTGVGAVFDLTASGSSKGNPNNPTTTTEAEICIDGNQQINGSCTNFCPNTGGGYIWIVREYTETGTVDNGGSIRVYGSAGTPETAMFNIDGRSTLLDHGTYDVLVQAVNDDGCVSDVVEVNGSTGSALVINDKPAVEIFHNYGDVTLTNQTSTDYHATTNPDEICIGRKLHLWAHPCSHDDFDPTTMNYTNNNTDQTGPANEPNLPETSRPYTGPCDPATIANPNNTFYSQVWTAKKASNPGTNLEFVQTTSASPHLFGGNLSYEVLDVAGVPASGGMAGNDTIQQPANTLSPTHFAVEIATDIKGEMIYELEATGFNGCSNTDQILVNVVRPVITFQNAGDPVIYPEGSSVPIPVCKNTQAMITAICTICEPGYSTTWNNTGLGPNIMDNTITNYATQNPVTSIPIVITPADNTNYRVLVEDATGCHSELNPSNGNTFDNIFLDSDDAPDVTGATYSGQLCSASPLTIELTATTLTDLANYDFEIYDEDPNSPGPPSPVYECAAGQCNINLTTGVFSTTALTGPTVAVLYPVDGRDYHIIAKPSGGGACETPIQVLDGTGGAGADVDPSPDARPAVRSFLNGVNNESYCNGSTGTIHLTNASTSWSYDWRFNEPQSRPRTANLPMGHTPLTNGDLSGFTNGGSSGGFFGGFLSFLRPNVGATFPMIAPTVYTKAVFQVLVSDGNCTQLVTFPDMEILDCQDPVLFATAYDAQGAVTIPQSQVSAGNPFAYICEGGKIDLFVDDGTSNYDFDWSTGETTATITVFATSASPDTVTNFVFVTEPDGSGGIDTVDYIEHTFVISRGVINLYPQGDFDPNSIDTSICRTENIYAQANCLTCYGDIRYEWDYNSGAPSAVNTTDGSIYQGYTQSPPGGTPAFFDIELQVLHGENGTCIDEVQRRVGINDLPVVDVMYNGVTVAAPSPTTNPLYRCDGQVSVLDVSCTSCTAGTGTIAWNTGATTPSINVLSQGGYYALITDQNSCRQISEIAIVVDALDGLNAPVIANPSEICAGRSANLQVTPCVGCSYTWYEQTIVTPPMGVPGPTFVGNNRIEPVTVAGVYYAEVTNAQQCVYTTQNLTISTNNVVPPIIRGTTDTICSNQTARLWTRYGAGFTYQWYKENSTGGLSQITGATDSSYTTLPGATGIYQVRVTDPNGCEEESSLYILELSNFQPVLANTGKTEICAGETVNLSTDLYPGWQYQWYRNGILMSGETGSIHYADSAGSYYVLVTNYHGCVAPTDFENLTRTELFKPNATTSTPTFCPGDNGRLSVSLCVDCEYEWFDVTPTSLSARSAAGFNYNNVTNTGSYYAVVYKGACSEISDTVTITRNAVFTPSINSISSVVCTGRDATLTTQGCSNCSYSWLKEGNPALGALNDTFHIITNTSDTGSYQIAVDYPNGCSDTSAVLRVIDGSYIVTIASNSNVICNGVGETINATITPPTTTPGVYSYTLFLNNTAIPAYTNVTTGASTYPFLNNNRDGAYTVEVINPDGCVELSTPIFLDTVNIIPTLTARATVDLNSTPASAICTDSGRVFLEVNVPNCPNCTFTWEKGGNPITHTKDTLITLPGLSGADLYVVSATDQGCTAPSNPVTILDNRVGFNNIITPDTTSICNGQSTTLAYNGNPCSGCSYRWLRTSNPINGANSASYVATLDGDYNLEVTTLEGCVDTSGTGVVLTIGRPVGLDLDLDSLTLILNATPNLGTGTPLAASANPIDLNSWVFPPTARHNPSSLIYTSYFSSSPFNAALNCNGAPICNPGLSGIDSITFTPADSLVGNHLITYHYFESGCEFTVQDVLRVLPAATITITNNNPASVPYEACITDPLTITAQNLKFRIEAVDVFDANGDYQAAAGPINFTYDTISYGSDTFYNSTITWTVPPNAYASYLRLTNTNPAPAPVLLDTIESPFLLIHNTDLSFTGLPSSGELCSNGERLTLFGNPQGGTYSVRDLSNNTMPGTIIGDSLYPTAINPLLYNDTSQLVDVVYSYNETYTNGNNCPDPDFVVQRIKAIDVELTNVDYNVISVSQEQEALTNLVYRVEPYKARANKQDYYDVSFSGSFTSPAGAPENFLPNNAGVGYHTLTYTITKGTCTNSIDDSVNVLPVPIDIAIPDTICRTFAAVNFGRDAAFPYIPNASPPPPNGVVSYTDTTYFMRVRGQGVTQNNPFLGSETFTYDPANVTSGNHDTLVIEYVFYRDEDTLTVDFDTLEYIVASIVKPIYIEDLLTVSINDTIVQSFYCQDSALSILTASPADTFGRGLFMLFGGTGQYQLGDTLFNSVINPYQVNNSENATTTYDLVYILNGVACQNADTMDVTISKGLNPSFVTANGLDEFCDTDPAVAIIQNVMAPDTAIWKIGGIPQPSYSFDPDPLNPGIHIVDLQQIYTYIQATDTFICSASATDTFTIHALPNINVTPALEKQYCANDTIVDFIVSPAPDCPSFGAAGQYVLEENFDAGVPASWIVNTIAGKPWAPDALFPQGGTGLATFVDTSNIVENSWLISPTMNLIAGHTYRLSYMVLAGPADPNCGSGCVASLYVGLGNSSATTAITTQLDYQPLIDNDLAYRRYTVDYFHNPGAGATTGPYHMGFRNFSPAFGRALRLDNVEMRDLTVDSCQQAGIGYMEGPGAYKVQDSLYQFDPLSVPAGNITVKYVYTNTMGCQDSVVFPIEVDTAPVVSFTNLDTSYCENEPTVMLTGSPLGGTFTSTQGTNLYDDTTFATLSPAFYPVSFQTNTQGVDIVSYTFTDNNNCSATAVDKVTIVELLDRNPIAGLDTRGYGYCIVDSANTLLVTNQPPLGAGSLITNGTFYGPGVRNGAAGAVVGGATFHSDSAVIDMGHTGDATISYVYTTTTNCLDTTYQTVTVHASPDLSFVNLPDSLCLNADSFVVIVQNRVVTGPLGQTIYIDTLGRQVGQFTETDIWGNPVDDFIRLFDTLYPYEAAGYSQINISYLYIADTAQGACEAVLGDSVRIDSVPVVYFQGLQDHYCENDPVSIFLAFPSFNVGSGYLLIDSVQIDSSFYWIDPAIMVGPGQTTAVYPTYYTFTDSRGCQGEVFDTFEVRPYPRITFSPTAQDTFCRQIGQRYDLRQLIVTPSGGFFTDNLALTSIRDSFYLDLGSQPGPRLVTYNYLDPTTLCQNSDSIWIYLFSAPELDFTVYGGCSQMDITFEGSANNLIAGVDSITRIWWDFEGNGALTYTQLDTSPITIPDTMYQYSASGTYNVTLYVQNQGACVQSITKPLIISPYYNLATGDYFEDFNTGTGDWFDEQPLGVTPTNIWSHQSSLNGAIINSPDGAWVTNGDTLYAPGESAWVYSPCFDFTNSIRPMIAFDVWRDMLNNIDGTILEYYDNNTNTWERMGDVEEGISWYQSNILLARPGDQQSVSLPRGWTGQSNGFESARLRLDQFRGERDIRFRVAFASSLQTVIDSISGVGFEGTAFDNVWVGERTRNVLVEHFSNQNYQTLGGLTSDNIDAIVYNKIYNPNYGNDVILLQYQVDDNSSTTPDPIYQSNIADLGGRSFDYSTQPGEIRIDGRLIGTGRSEDLNEWEMDYDMLQFPDFEIRITQPVTVVGNLITSNATVEALRDLPSDQYVVHMAVIQDSLTFNVRNFNMLSIVRKMLPSNIGVSEAHAWTNGQPATVIHSWDYGPQLNVASFNPNQLEVVVFVQNERTNEIYQAATTQDMNRYNGTQTIATDPRTEIFDLNVYPNPASDLFNVAFDKALEQTYNWRLVDIAGRTLQVGTAEAGTEQFTIDADRLVDGAYFFVINSEDQEVYAQRKLIVIKR